MTRKTFEEDYGQSKDGDYKVDIPDKRDEDAGKHVKASNLETNWPCRRVFLLYKLRQPSILQVPRCIASVKC